MLFRSLLVDDAHADKEAWGKASYATCSIVLNKIADRMEQNLALLAVAETWDNGKPSHSPTIAFATAGERDADRRYCRPIDLRRSIPCAFSSFAFAMAPLQSPALYWSDAAVQPD